MEFVIPGDTECEFFSPPAPLRSLSTFLRIAQPPAESAAVRRNRAAMSSLRTEVCSFSGVGETTAPISFDSCRMLSQSCCCCCCLLPR